MASPLSAPQPRSTPAITAVSSGSKVCKKFNLLCAELQVVLGSGLALALGANTDVHTRRSWLCRSAVGFGALSGKLTSLLSLCGAGTLPAPTGRNQRHSGAELEEHLPSLLPFCAKEGLPGLQRRRLCLPSQIRVGGGGLGVLSGCPPMPVAYKLYGAQCRTPLHLACCDTVYQYLGLRVCLALSVSAYACVSWVYAFGVRGPASLRSPRMSVTPKCMRISTANVLLTALPPGNPDTPQEWNRVLRCGQGTPKGILFYSENE